MSIVLSTNGTQTLHPDKHDSNESSKKYGSPPITRIIPGSVKRPDQVWPLPEYEALSERNIAEPGTKLKSLHKWIAKGPGAALKPIDRAILIALVNAAGRKHVRHAGRRWVAITYAGIKFLSEGQNASPATVKRSLKRLELAGIITRQRSYGMNALTIVEWHDAPCKPAHQSEPTVESNCTHGGVKVSRGWDQNEPAHVYQSSHISTSTSVATASPLPLAGTSGAGTSTKHAAAAADISHHQQERERDQAPAAAAVNAETYQALARIGITGRTLTELACTALTPKWVRTMHEKYLEAGQRKKVNTGLLVKMLRDQAETLPAILEIEQQDQRKLVAWTLSVFDEKRYLARKAWVRNGGPIEAATIDNPEFIEWAGNRVARMNEGKTIDAWAAKYKEIYTDRTGDGPSGKIHARTAAEIEATDAQRAARAVEYLTNEPTALASAAAKWERDGGKPSDATIDNPRFIEWFVYETELTHDGELRKEKERNQERQRELELAKQRVVAKQQREEREQRERERQQQQREQELAAKRKLKERLACVMMLKDAQAPAAAAAVAKWEQGGNGPSKEPFGSGEIFKAAFIEWCIEDFRAAGTLDELVNAYTLAEQQERERFVKKMEEARDKARTLAPEPSPRVDPAGMGSTTTNRS
jgi:hypothetical protein